MTEKLIQLLYIVHRENVAIMQVMSNTFLKEENRKAIKQRTDEWEKTFRDVVGEDNGK